VKQTLCDSVDFCGRVQQEKRFKGKSAGTVVQLT